MSLSNQRKLYLAGTVSIAAAMVLSFQNCSQTKFDKVDLASSKTVGTTSELVDDGKCLESRLSSEPISVSPLEVGEGNEILGYELGEVNCGSTSFLVKVKYLGQFETYFAFRNDHKTGKNELISKTEQGYAQPIYSMWFSTSSDGSSVLYVPQKIVDRSPTPIVPEVLVRRVLATGKIQIVNKYDTKNKLNGQLIPIMNFTNPSYKFFDQKVSESQDGSIVLFFSATGHLIKKDLNTGDTTDLNFTDNELDARAPKPLLRSFSLTADGSKALYARTIGDKSHLFLSGVVKKGGYSINLFADQNNTVFDGYDVHHKQNSIISADGKSAFFIGNYIGGRPSRVSPFHVMKMDIETKQVEVISTSSAGPGSENISIPNAKIKSVSADGRFVCFLAPENFAAAAELDAAPSKTQAFIKDTIKGELKLVSTQSAGGQASDCAISASGKTVTYEVINDRAQGEKKLFHGLVE